MKKTMGEMIAAMRKEKGMTQKDLAEQMGVTDKAVSKWERDLSCPDINSVPQLAHLLGVSVEELMQASAQKPQENQAQQVVDTVLKAVPLAMGVAVVVTSILGGLSAQSGFTMLGIGMACLAVRALKGE